MWIAEAKKKTSKRWRNRDVSWAQFCAQLETPMRTKETMREYRAMKKEERDVLKELPGGFVAGYLTDGMRKTANVRERSMITLDADHGGKGDWEAFTCLFDDVACVCYSTHSHTPEHPRLRWIFPASRPILPDEYPAVSRKVAEWVGIDTIDATTHDLCRLFYYPGVSCDATYVYHVQPGAPVDVDAILASYGPENAWKDSTLWPIGKEEQEIRVRQLQHLGDPREKPGIIGLFCRTYDIPEVIDAFLSDVYTEAGTDRYTYAGGSTAGGARVYNDGQYLYSSHATDPAGGQSCNAFDLVRIHKWGHMDEVSGEDTPVSKLPSYTEMVKWCTELPEVKEQMVAEKHAEMADLWSDLGGTETAADDQIDGSNDQIEADDSWKKKLDLNKKTGECEPTQNNALLILRNDPALKDAFGYDLFNEVPKLRRDVPWRPKGSVKTDGRGILWTDQDDAGLRWYMQLVWKFRSDNDLRSALEQAFHMNEFHPVRDYLQQLVWDGTERIDTLLQDAFGVEDNAYTRAVSRKWMCGAVARVMRPGVKFDCVPVLVGAQGVGKSTFASLLAKGWFNDSMINMGSKDGYESLRGSWIIELGELASLKRQEVDSIKAFVAKQEDTYRAAYARRAATYPRQCVFIGSTNEAEFLKDRTGERRWWPVNVEHKLDRQRLTEAVDQLWAEAVVRWKAGEYLDLETEEQLNGWKDMVAGHSVQDDLLGLVQEYLDKPLPANWEDMSPELRRDWIQGDVPDAAEGTAPRMTVCLPEIKVELLKEDRVKGGGNDLLTRRLANLMNNMPGWYKQKKRARVPGYGAQWTYRRKQTDLRRWRKEQLEQADDALGALLS